MIFLQLKKLDKITMEFIFRVLIEIAWTNPKGNILETQNFSGFVCHGYQSFIGYKR